MYINLFHNNYLRPTLKLEEGLWYVWALGFTSVRLPLQFLYLLSESTDSANFLLYSILRIRRNDYSTKQQISSVKSKRRHRRKVLLPLVIGVPFLLSFFLSYLQRCGRAACHGSSLLLLSRASVSALAYPHSGAYPPFSTAASGFAFAQSRPSFAPASPHVGQAPTVRSPVAPSTEHCAQ